MHSYKRIEENTYKNMVKLIIMPSTYKDKNTSSKC